MPNCKKCGDHYPNRVVINGKVRILNKRKFCLSCSPFGRHNCKDLTRYPNASAPNAKICQRCKQELALEHFYLSKGRPMSYCKTCANQMTIAKQRNIKRWAVAYKGGQCERCGYNKCLAALEFHHKNPATKRLTLGRNQSFDYDYLKQELDQCSLLCANCHREVEDANRQSKSRTWCNDL